MLVTLRVKSLRKCQGAIFQLTPLLYLSGDMFKLIIHVIIYSQSWSCSSKTKFGVTLVRLDTFSHTCDNGMITNL